MFQVLGDASEFNSERLPGDRREVDIGAHESWEEQKIMARPDTVRDAPVFQRRPPLHGPSNSHFYDPPRNALFLQHPLLIHFAHYRIGSQSCIAFRIMDYPLQNDLQYVISTCHTFHLTVNLECKLSDHEMLRLRMSPFRLRVPLWAVALLSVAEMGF